MGLPGVLERSGSSASMLGGVRLRSNTGHITDGKRAVIAVKGGEGKRLTDRQPH